MIETLLLALLFLVPNGRAEADRLFAEKDWPAAREAYQAVLDSIEPPGERAEVLDRIGRTWLNEGDLWEAESWFTRSIEAADSGRARLDRGRAYFYAGERAANDPTSLGAEVRSLMNDAARDLEKAVELTPDSADAWYFLAYAEWYRERPEEAEKGFRKALELDPGHSDSALQLARFREAAGRVEEARATLESVPEDLRTAPHWMMLGRLRAAAGDREKSVDAWRRALLLDPTDQDAYNGLWNETARQTHYAEFDRVMEAVLAVAPDAWLPHYYLGFSNRLDGRPQVAIEQFRKAYEKNPEHVKSLTTVGDILLDDLKKDDEATEVYLKVLAADPGNARALSVLRVMAFRKALAKDYAAAERLYAAMAAGDPTDWSHTANLAIVMKETGRIEQAIELYRGAAERFPFEPQILNDLGLLYMGIGRKAEGMKAFRDALEIDPESLDSLENLGSFARLDGRLEEALEYYGRAYERVRREGGDSSKFRRLLDMVAREIEQGAGR